MEKMGKRYSSNVAYVPAIQPGLRAVYNRARLRGTERMKLYTGQGDDGHTVLFGGTRVPKNDSRICAYGDVDECNATIGLAVAHGAGEETVTILRQVQGELFMLGAELAAPQGNAPSPRIDDNHISRLERWIDAATEETPSTRNFVLPGGTAAAAALHLARTVCRRAERNTVGLSMQQSVRPAVLVYLNRLSDLLFALARRENHHAGVADIPWIASKS